MWVSRRESTLELLQVQAISCVSVRRVRAMEDVFYYFFFFMWHDVRINYDENRSKQLKTISRISTRMPADVGMAIGWELFFSLHVLMSGYFRLRPDLESLTHLRTDLSHFWFLISFFCELTPDLNLRDHFQPVQIDRASREREAIP